MSQPEGPVAVASAAANYVSLIEQLFHAAERELSKGEHLRVVVCTPEGRVEASQLEGADPNLLVVHGVRSSRPLTWATSPADWRLATAAAD